MRAIIIGATGATGKELVHQLLASNDCESVVIFVRRPLSLDHPRLTTRIVDFNQPEKWQHLVQGNVAFSCLGTTLRAAGSKQAQWKVDVDYQFEFAEAAHKNGVPHFILVSSYGANAKSTLFYSRMKGELEQRVRTLGFPQLTVFQPGMLLRPDSDRFSERAGAAVIGSLANLGIFKSYRPLPTATLAKAMINASKIKSDGVSEIKLAAIFGFAEK